MSNEQVIAEIRELGYPDTITDVEIIAAVRSVLRDIKYEYPAMIFGVFNLVAGQQDYDLFNPVPFEATSQGVFPEGIRAYELVVNSSGETLDVFGLAPLLQGFSFWPGVFPNTFYTPGDWTIWDLNWSAFAHRFSNGEFEHVSDLTGAPIRIYSGSGFGCGAGGTALLRFTRFRTEQEIRDEDESWFLKLVEARVARILANKFSLCAGMTFSEAIKDEGKKVKYWADLAKELKAEGWCMFDAHRRDQISPVQRS